MPLSEVRREVHRAEEKVWTPARKLRHLLKRGEAQDVLDAARQAGRELVSLEECMRMQNE